MGERTSGSGAVEPESSGGPGPVEVVFAGTPGEEDAALCRRFGVPVVPAAGPERWRLQRVEGTLVLAGPGARPWTLDLRSGPLARRLAGCKRSEPLPRAVGMRRHGPRRVLDATAGLGRDALVLARLGCEVAAVERLGALAMMLADAAAGAPWGGRLTVRSGDALEVLAGLRADERPEVVYLDPMFMTAGTAQVKKEAQLLRLLAGPPGDLEALFAAAMAGCRERVVVKRHHGAKPLGGVPNHVVQGTRLRFDVYLRPGPAVPAGG